MITCGGGGNSGRFKLSSCATEWLYVWESFRISAAAASRSPFSFLIRPAESGSFRADSAALRLASGSPVGRGIAALAWAIAVAVSPRRFDASLLNSPRRSVALARSALHVRNESAPSPFHFTICGRIFSSSPIFEISFAALDRRSATPWTAALLAWSSHAIICLCDMPSNDVEPISLPRSYR